MELGKSTYEEQISWRVWFALILISTFLALFTARSINNLIAVEADPQDYILVAGGSE